MVAVVVVVVVMMMAEVVRQSPQQLQLQPQQQTKPSRYPSQTEGTTSLLDILDEKTLYDEYKSNNVLFDKQSAQPANSSKKNNISLLFL